jgi:outer membrane protein assembly factor BamB
VSDFGGQNPEWGYSESPLVDGEKVIVTPGGASARLVALNKMTGTNFWRSPIPDSGGAQYSSAIVATVDEQRQYIQFLHKGVVGVAAEDGRFLWRYEKPANGVANCSTPLCYSNTVFAASAYGTGGGSARLTRNGNTTRVEEVYFTRHMMNHHGGMVLIDGHVYGHSEENLVCLQFISGKVVWRDRRPGKGSIAYADGRLYFRRENGQVFLVEANPKEYVERGRFDQSDRSDQQAWPHPVIANGRLYLRDQDVLLCYDVKQR